MTNPPTPPSADALAPALLPMMYECCADWKEQTARVNGPIALQQIRAGQSFPADHFVPWRYCPWCGASRLAVPSSSALAPERIAEIRARLDALAYREWYMDGTCAGEGHDDTNPGCVVAIVAAEADAEFISHAPTDMADLLADRERLERRVGELTMRDTENESLFRWLLGEEGEFPESLPRARYNFRSELRRRLAARATPEPSNGNV